VRRDRGIDASFRSPRGLRRCGRLRAPACGDLVEDLPPQRVQIHDVEGGLVDELHGARRQRVHRGLGSLPGVDREHDDLEPGLPAQQSAQHLDPVHARHRHVQRDQVGVGAGNQLQRLQAVGRLADHPEPRLGVEDPRQCPPHEGGIVHHEDADHQSGMPFR
jgi:hypothetical protein